MSDEKREILLKLNEKLKYRPFSESTKFEIISAISKAYDNYSKPKDKKAHFEEIIKAIEQVERFEIDTREQLNEIVDISSLSDCAVGGVSKDRTLVVIEPDEEKESTIYHETIHLTQRDNVYYIDNSYPFSNLITHCLKEGEAAYYESDLHKISDYCSIELLEGSNNEDIVLVGKGSYLFFHMIYQVMLDIFGEELMEKWKHTTLENDMIPLLKKRFEEKIKTISFIQFYGLITKMIFEYSTKLKSRKNKLAVLAHDELGQLTVRSNKFKEGLSNLEKIKDSYNQTINEINKINEILADQKLLKEKFEKFLSEEKIELEEYKKRKDCDKEIVSNWQYDIETATLQKYYNYLLKELDNYKKNLRYNSIDYKKLYDILAKHDGYFYNLNSEFYMDSKLDLLNCYENGILNLVSKDYLKEFFISKMSIESIEKTEIFPKK